MAAFRAMALFDFLPQMQQLADPAAAGALFAPLAEEQYEVAAFVYLDEQQRDYLSIREIVADALKHNASGVVMAHNHPSGDPMPSPADCEATRMLARALDPIGIRLLDHLVVTRTGVTSFRTLGLL